jgi:thiol-disulfide isomerase/thioredoxin
MKRLIVVLLICVHVFTARSQEIKKLKITELEAYIHSCDHPLIVNFWATFCAPCVAEIPHFQNIAGKYKDRKLELLLVSLDLPDDYPVKIAAFARKQKFSAPLAWLNETDADYFCPKIDKSWSGAIPSTLFINNETKYHRFFEQALTGEQFEENIKTLLQNP